MLQRIYNILYQFRSYVLLALLIIISILLISLNNNPQVKQIRSATTVVFGILQKQISFIPSYFALKSENEALRHINIDLADEAQRLREAKLENIRLRQLLALKDQLPYKLIAVRVVNKNLTLLRNTITIDCGSADGIQPQMPVIGDGGLAGIVTTVTKHYSVVNILLNTDFRASAKIQRSRVDGIVAWDGKTLNLKNVPKTRDVKPGDVVITSEYSNTFPADIRIGIVNEVKEQESSLFKSIVVNPGIDFIKLEELFIVAFIPDTARTALEQYSLPGSGKQP